MDFLREKDIEYLIDAAHDTCRVPPRCLPQYIPYRLLKEAEKMIENQIPTYFTQSLISRIHKKLSVIKDKSIPACPKGYEENDSTLQVLVRFYEKINEQLKRKDDDDIYKFISKFKSLRTALKMLIRLERGITSEEDFFNFIRENELPEKVLENTEYDGRTRWIPMSRFGQRRFQGNMNVPSKRDIEYLLDAAEKTSFDDDIPKYFPCLLYQEAYQALERLERHQKCSLIGHAKNNRDLAIKFRSVFPRIKGEGIHFPTRPEEYGKNDPTIKVLAEYYREYIKKKKIDQIRKEDEKHKKWGTLSANFQKLEGGSAMRERILTTAKALRTASKMLCRAQRGKTEEDFIRENEIQKEEAIESLKLGVKDFPTRIEAESYLPVCCCFCCCIEAESSPTRVQDVLDCLQEYFGFQESSVSNQRENIVHLLSIELMRLGTPGEQALEVALEKVFSRTLDNYIEWRKYLGKKTIWKNTNVLVNATGNDENSTAKDKNVISKNKKILYISLYYLIWGEAANVRFLPECLCYIFHRMWKHLDKHLSLNRDSLNEQVPQSLYKGSFIDQVIQPLYEVIAAVLQDTEYDEDVTYNIIPFDGRQDLLPEVQEAINSLKLVLEGFTPRNPRHDVLDCLQKVFGFQGHSVKNQRENIVNLLSNEQMRPFTPGEHGTAIDKALDSVFKKTLGNYIEWCNYLGKKPIWKNTNVPVNATGNDGNATAMDGNATPMDGNADGNATPMDGNATAKDENVISKEKKILYISLYYLIWGEAANVRFLPECLCYIFHRMSEELDPKVVISDSFIKRVIEPLYKVIAAEADINKNRDTSHSKWRNYDDFNEYFWSKDCFQLGWPLNTNSPFFKKPPERSTTVFGKTSFVERRTFLHLYHSFHRMWIFHVMMFEALVIFAFNDGELNLKTLTETLTVTYFLMKLIQSILDIWLKYGAYSNTSCVDVLRILARFFWSMLATLIICFPRMKCLQEKTGSVEESIGFENFITVLGIYAVNFWKCFQEKTSLIEELIGFKNYIIVLGVYAFSKISFSISYQFLPQIYENSFIAPLIKWINQEEYVGRGMGEKLTDIFRYMLFWLVTLGFNVALTYYGLISPLVIPTRDINIHNMLAIGSLWAGVVCAYIVGSHVSYNVTSAFVGTFVGHTERLGNIKSLGDVHKHFNEIPKAFMHLHTWESPPENDQEDVTKLVAAEFSPFWNQIVMNLREEDYISDLEQYALNMPENSGSIDAIHWPLFLLFGKVFHAIRLLKIAQQQQQQQSRWREVWERVWNEISRDDVYMKYAVEECFHSVKFILRSVLKDEGKKWVEGIYEDIESSKAGDGNLCLEFQLNKLENFVKAISELTEILNIQEDADNRLIYSAEQALQNVIRHDFLGNKRFAWLNISVIWPEDPELRSQIKRLHFLLTTKSAAHVPRNREARRRLEFFINSLFMSMPKTMPVPKMLSFSVLTPYYEETVLYSLDELESSNDDGVALIDYLKNLYPDEWTNYCERMKKRYTDVDRDRDRDRYEYRLWASYRGQTLARTVRGTMYYQKALLLQAYREMLIAVGLGEDGQTSTFPVPDLSKNEATLDSLEKRSLKHTRIPLRGEENYNPWKENMIKMLKSQTTTDFVESQVKYVRNYPQKWKKLDKKVKDWIMASLNDTLKNMVKEMKTAIELWETLKIFFTRPDTKEISSMNVKEYVSELLNKDHYRMWVLQMEKFLQEKGMFGYINGKLKDPDPKGKSSLDTVKEYSGRWKELDTQVRKWIIDSLSESMRDSVKDSETAEQMWDALKEIIGSQCLDYAKAHVDLKFTYVVSCQIYGQQKSKGKDVAADIAFLLKKNEGLRVAFIDEVFNEEGYKEFYSKLVKADKNGKEMEVYSIKLPGDPRLGEGKPENQNHAIVFTRGNAIQTIDMNQDNYFEETLKMRNLLEEFHRKDDAVKDDAVKDDVIHPPTILGKPSKITKDDVIHPPTILGIREHIFTGSASSLASFMSNQETGFVTLGQRVIANPLKVRMHYGHPDVFDRVFHITRGGISKASRGINISEDIYAGFNSTLRQGSVTHHEYIQAGKGRDVGFNQIATFEGKVAGGNGEQVLSRDIYRLGLRLDFFRMLSFYYTTVGYYFSSLLMVITLYIILYGNLIMALSGTRVPHVLNDIDMAPEWFLMIVLLPAIYMLLVPYLEQGLEKAVESFLAMFFSLGSIFFAFSLGTRIHWFGRTIIHGGASYQATGRGFVLHHITFSENYRLYSRSHFVKGMEVLFLVVVYIIYGFHSVRAFYNNLLLLGGSILSISWIVAPFLFDSSPFDLNKNSEDQEDWKNWLNRKSDEVEKSKRIEEKVKESWEIWWTRELDHIRTPAGRIIETILSLRFFIFPLVVGYKLDVQGLKNSLSNCVIPWIFLVGILFAHEFFSNKKPEIYFFSYNQLATIGALAIAYYYSAFGDMLAFFIAIITTVWGFLSICVACKPTLKRFSLWTPVKYLARICDTGMGALMFRIANMFSQRSIKQYLVRNMFDQNISELLHNSSTELKMQSTTWVGDPTTRNATSSSISKPPFYRSRDEYINMLPAMYHNFIVDVRDVDRDGNSGFRAVAVGLGRHQNEWKNIRSDLLQELEKHKKGYRKMFPGQYDIVKNRLTFFKDDEFAPEEKWMEMPAIGVLIATHFKVILHIITNSGSQTYLPLYSCPPSWNRLKFISLGHVDNHYVHLLLKKGYPMPHLMEFYRKSKWKRMYLKWIKEGNIS